MHYRIRYMHVKYQRNRDKRFVKTVNTKNKFNCMNLQLPIAFFKKSTLSDMHHRKTYMYIKFQQIYLQTFANCINLQLAIRFSKNHAYGTCTTPSRTFRPILRSICLLDNELPRKEIISTDDRRTDGQTDGTTDRRTDVAHDNNR